MVGRFGPEVLELKQDKTYTVLLGSTLHEAGFWSSEAIGLHVFGKSSGSTHWKLSGRVVVADQVKENQVFLPVFKRRLSFKIKMCHRYRVLLMFQVINLDVSCNNDVKPWMALGAR